VVVDDGSEGVFVPVAVDDDGGGVGGGGGVVEDVHDSVTWIRNPSPLHSPVRALPNFPSFSLVKSDPRTCENPRESTFLDSDWLGICHLPSSLFPRTTFAVEGGEEEMVASQPSQDSFPMDKGVTTPPY